MIWPLWKWRQPLPQHAVNKISVQTVNQNESAQTGSIATNKRKLVMKIIKTSKRDT